VLTAVLPTPPAGAASPGPLRSLPQPEWTGLFPGLEFTRVRAARYCRTGEPGIAFVRLDPERCRIEPYHEREYPDRPPAGLDGWQKRLHAPVVVNAGLYDPDRVHLGIFRRHGRDLGGRSHSRWKALLVSGGRAAPRAGLLDLSREADRTRAAAYPHAVQSLMLLDRSGRIRVRRSEKVARRSGVATDASGRLFIFVTEGGYTLYETALLLRESGWGLVAAMALDGGREAELAVTSDPVRYRTADHTEGGWMETEASLPAVIAVWPSAR